MTLTADDLEERFEKKKEEVNKLQEIHIEKTEELNELDIQIKEGIGELKGYQKLYKECFAEENSITFDSEVGEDA